MELLSFLSVLLAVVTLGLGQTTHRVSCNLEDEVTCLRAELSAVKVAVEELLLKNKVLQRENTDLQEQIKNLTTELQDERNKSVNLQNEVDKFNISITGCSQPVVPSCSQPSGSDKFIYGGHKSNSSFNEVLTTIQQRNSRSDLYVFSTSTWAYRMAIIQGQLWVPVYHNHTIQILDPNMSSKIKEITLTKVHTNMYPISVHQTNSNNVLLAADQGLYVLDIHGSVLYKVGDGEIADIFIDCDRAFVYNSTNNHVVTLVYNARQWVVTNTFTANKSTRYRFNTLTYLHNHIYLASYASNDIQAYSITGAFVYTYGIQGSTLPGQLLHPVLCGTDSQGSLLICGNHNHRLQVMSPGGTWQVYVLQGVMSSRAVVIDTSGYLWVLWHDYSIKFTISKFSV